MSENSPDTAETILLVDDDPINLEVLANVLKPHGYRVLQAMNGSRALSIASHAKPDLVLLDVQMPGLDGYETCRRMKADEELRNIPVLFLSAQKDARNKVQGFKSGGVDYIDKPFNYDELLARVQTHLALKKAREDLRIKNEEIESLLHILSHDLMNPVSAVSGFVHLAKRAQNEDDAESGLYWDMIDKATHQMEEIINHVREMHALDSGKIRVVLSPVSLREVIGTARTIFQNRLDKKELELKTNLNCGEEDWYVVAEPVSLTHNVINNLISNAIKFSYRKSEISVIVEREDDNVHIQVRDEGIGMPTSLLNNLFRTDQPTSRPGTEDELGTGFGMPLVKKYMDFFGGIIRVESRPVGEFPDDHGTTVHLILQSSAPDDSNPSD